MNAHLRPKPMSARCTFIAVAIFSLTACTKEQAMQTVATGTGYPVTDGGVPGAARPAAPSSPVVAAKPFEIIESDFTESERHRDPFRSYAAFYVDNLRKAVKSQRQVNIAGYAVEELHLIGVISGADSTAMLVDPTGRGWVVRKGEYIGRPDVVKVSGSNGVEYQVNWRVQKIRASDVVLVREDPANPTSAPQTRVISLHADTESKDGAPAP